MAATEQYRQESDRLKELFEDRCVFGPGDGSSWGKDGHWVPVSELYPAYTSWAEANGTKYAVSKDQFDKRLEKLGRKRAQLRPEGGRGNKQIRVWLGIRLRTVNDD